MKKLQLLLAIMAVLFLLSGCEKAKVVNDASCDVFTKAITDASGTTVYTAIHSVFSYNSMKSVSVKSPDGLTMDLTNFQNSGNSFFNQPVESDYVQLPPTAGVYTYTVTFSDGEVKTYTNTLASSSLQPAVITSLSKNSKGDSVYFAWNAIPSVDAYQLKVSRGTTQVFYQAAFKDGSSPLKANLKVGFLVSYLSSGVAGTYTFELSGMLFETTDYSFIQALSTSTKDIDL